ncbi:MAG: glycosyltransferase [Candidatus Desantisbacteria bacterium]
MNILFILSQMELTGAETYAVSLIQRLQVMDHKIIMVSDTLNSCLNIPYYSLDLNKRKSPFNRIKHVLSLIRIIRQENITLIHAHSRASSWPAYFASRIAHIPLVTTAHCIYPVHISSKLMPCFGEKIIAISDAVRKHLIKDFGIKDNDISLIPNGIDVNRFSPQIVPDGLRENLRIQPETRVISWVGRFSGGRGELIEEMMEEVFPEVLMNIPNLLILIVAGGERTTLMEARVQSVNRQFNREVIRLTGLRQDMPQIYGLSDMVIGAGRVALEAMACARPVIAVGERKYIGLLTPLNIEEGITTNFGDCCQSEPIDWKAMSRAMIELLKDEDKIRQLGAWGREIVSSRFNLDMVAERVVGVYDELQ